MNDLNRITNETTSDPEILNSLSDHEKRLCDIMALIEIRGKFGKRVALLLTPNMTGNLSAIEKYHIKNHSNIRYVFKRPGSERPYRGPDALREIMKKLEPELHHLLTFTDLRKHIATISQISELSSSTQDSLATFLGHDIRIHRKHYRMPIDIVDKAKVAKILLSVNEGHTDWNTVDVLESG